MREFKNLRVLTGEKYYHAKIKRKNVHIVIFKKEKIPALHLNYNLIFYFSYINITICYYT